MNKLYYLCRQCWSAWVERLRRLFVCLSVCPQHNSKNEWFQRVQTWCTVGNDLGIYTQSDMLLGINGQSSSHRVSKSFLHTRTVIHQHSLGDIASRLWLCLLCTSLTFWRNQCRRRGIKLYVCLPGFSRQAPQRHWHIRLS